MLNSGVQPQMRAWGAVSTDAKKCHLPANRSRQRSRVNFETICDSEVLSSIVAPCAYSLIGQVHRAVLHEQIFVTTRTDEMKKRGHN